MFGDPVQIALGKVNPLDKDHASERAKSDANAFAIILGQTCELIAEERFLNWQVTFPGVVRLAVRKSLLLEASMPSSAILLGPHEAARGRVVRSTSS